MDLRYGDLNMGDKVRILILEDVPLDLELMETELKREGINFVSRCVEEEEDYRREIIEFQTSIFHLPSSNHHKNHHPPK